MVKKLSLLLGVGSIVLIGVLIVGFGKKSETGTLNQKVSTTQEQEIMVYPTSGEVSFKATPEALLEPITISPTVVPNRAIVSTGTGTAVVLLPDNSSITLSDHTEITINYSPTNTSIYQSLGTTYHRVEALVTGSHYQVQTPGTLAAVRGTKFSVVYNKEQKKTKISVTEHQVEVTSTKKSASEVATTTEGQSVFVNEGKTADVSDAPIVTEGKKGAVVVIDTEKDTDKNLKEFITKEKEQDVLLKATAKEVKEKREDAREVIKRIIIEPLQKKANEDKDVSNDIQIRKESTKEDNKISDRPQDKRTVIQEKVTSQETGKKIDQKQVSPEVVKEDKKEDAPKSTELTREIEGSQEAIPVNKKISEEVFFTTFEGLFIKYFYLDEQDTPCTLQVKAQSRVEAVTAYAKRSGYPFTKDSLPSFAEAIDQYCLKKDKETKVKLQSRFDDEYPF